jgi:hypothetical protein
MKRVLIIFLLALCFTACKKSSGSGEVLGVVKDMTGLDGCTTMIILDNGQKLEIKSLPLGVMLIKDKRVAIRYTVVLGFSICMAGDIAEITSLRYL